LTLPESSSRRNAASVSCTARSDRPRRAEPPRVAGSASNLRYKIKLLSPIAWHGVGGPGTRFGGKFIILGDNGDEGTRIIANIRSSPTAFDPAKDSLLDDDVERQRTSFHLRRRGERERSDTDP
jgi:hypothetical protein